MHNLISLIKISLKNSNNIVQNNNSNKKYNPKKDKMLKYSVLILLFIICSIPFGFMGFSQGMLVKDLDVNIFDIIVPTSAFLIAFTSLPFVVSILFLQDDAKDLLYLPIKSRDIFISKIITSIIQSYSFVALFFLPFLIGTLIGLEASFDIFIYALLFFALSPILPIVIFALLFTLLSRIINFKAHKTLIQNIVVFFPLIIMILMQFLMPEFDTITPDEYQVFITEFFNGTGEMLKNIFFMYIPSINSLSASSWYMRLVYSLLSIIVIIGIASLISIIVSKLYLKSLLKEETIKKNSKQIEDKDYNNTNSFKSLLKSEIKGINRNSTYVFNLIIPIFIFPILLLISMGFSVFSSPDILEDIKSLNGFLSLKSSINVGIILSTILFFSSNCFISSTAITRMGKSAYFVKMIPIKGSKIILSKIFYGVILSSIMSLLLLILLTIAGLIPLFDGLLIFITLIPINIFLNYLAISMDLKKPNLNWNTEIEACKNSTRSLIYMLITWGLAILLVLLMFLMETLGSLLNFEYMGYIFLSFILILSIIGSLLYYQHYDNMTNSEIFKNF